jgi:hypothetical protein
MRCQSLYWHFNKPFAHEAGENHMSKIETLNATLTTKQAALEKAKDKVTALTAAIATLVDRIANIGNEEAFAEALNRDLVGKKVSFYFGRGEKRRELEGVVIAYRAQEGRVGAQVKVQTGEGFDAALNTVPVVALISVEGVDYKNVQDEEPAPEGTPGAAVESNDDPLASADPFVLAA